MNVDNKLKRITKIIYFFKNLIHYDKNNTEQDNKNNFKIKTKPRIDKKLKLKNLFNKFYTVNKNKTFKKKKVNRVKFELKKAGLFSNLYNFINKKLNFYYFQPNNVRKINFNNLNLFFRTNLFIKNRFDFVKIKPKQQKKVKVKVAKTIRAAKIKDIDVKRIGLNLLFDKLIFNKEKKFLFKKKTELNRIKFKNLQNLKMLMIRINLRKKVKPELTNYFKFYNRSRLEAVQQIKYLIKSKNKNNFKL